MIATRTRVVQAGLTSAAIASTAFALVFFVLLIGSPGDAGLSVVNVILMSVLGLFTATVAFFGFLTGIFTIGILAYVALESLKLTGPAWAVATGTVLAFGGAWLIFDASSSRLGQTALIAAAVGGGLGGLSFRHVVRQAP